MIAFLLLIGVKAQYLPSSGKCLGTDFLYTNNNQTFCFTCQKGCINCCDPMICNACDTAYRFNSTLGTCIRCPVNCQVCEASGLFSKCNKCTTGYVLDTSDYSCKTCGSDCISCSVANYCSQCKDGFYVNKGVCTDCPYGCKSCTLVETSTFVCDTCIDRYYLVGEICHKCPTGCLTCTDEFTCTSCEDAYVLKDTKLCDYCTPNCKKCSGDTCTTCLTGYTLTSTNTCVGCPDINCNACLPDDTTKCTLCASGYYLLSNTCITCDKNCGKCDTPGHCVNCNSGFYSKSGLCTANTIQNCLVQTETVCTTCNTGYYLKNGKCIECIDNCLSCTESYQCDQCATAYFFNGFACESCGTGCETCYDSNICLKCTYGNLFKMCRWSLLMFNQRIVNIQWYILIWIIICINYFIMNSFVYSFKNPSSDFVDSANFIANRRPNQFCLKIFNQQSFDDFKIEDLQQGHQQSQENMFPPLSISQFFLNPQMSLDLKSKLPSLEKYIKKKRIHKKAKIQSAAIRDYKKNICRNILRHSIKGIGNQLSQSFLTEQFGRDQQKVCDFQKFYQQNLEIISGFRVLKDHLIISHNEPQDQQERKRVFQQYLIWFLRSQATKCILQSEANNIAEYVKYKNDVLLYYVQQPQQWYSNKPLWKIDN